MTTRSSQLWIATVPANVNQDVYKCPAATITLLKSLQVYNGAATTEVVSIYISSAMHALSFPAIKLDVPATRTSEWNGWIVLEPNDGVTIVHAAAQLVTLGSGALLPQPTS